MQAPELRPGEVFAGRYRIEEVLGEGGYGRVYRATQLPLGRAVALKTISTAYDDGAARFEREASIAQRLEHPNTVRLYDFGRENGLPFLVLELLRGRSLEDILVRQGPLDVKVALRITSQVLQALMEAHDLGIIHRDIKPANVFVSSHSGQPHFVKVLDFGLAKEIGGAAQSSGAGDGPTRVPLTKMGQVMGTPNYMAPELVTNGVLTPRTDLYAVGIMLAEMLTGQVLVDGPDAPTIALKQASPRPLPLPPAVTNSAVGSIVERAVAKNPDRRYASAGEMLEAVDAVIARTASASLPAAAPFSITKQASTTRAHPVTEPARQPVLPFAAPPPVRIGRQPARAVKRSPALILGVSALAGVVVTVAIALSIMALRPRSSKGADRSASAKPTALAKSARAAPSSSPPPPATLISQTDYKPNWPKSKRAIRGKKFPTDMNVIAQKLIAAGYKVVSQQSSEGDMPQRNVNVYDTRCTGAVVILLRPDPAVREAHMGAYDPDPGALVYEGDGLFMLVIAHANNGPTFDATPVCSQPIANVLVEK